MSVKHERASWLLDKRREIEERYDRVFASDYDLRFPDLGETHIEFVELVSDTLNVDSWVLDVGCSTGKHWPAIFASGARVIGVDISAQMVRRAKEKYPYVTVVQQAVQDLSMSEKFDAGLFVDVFETIGPEDWPVALANLRSVMMVGGILYFTVPDRPDDAQLEQSLLISRQRGGSSGDRRIGPRPQLRVLPNGRTNHRVVGLHCIRCFQAWLGRWVPPLPRVSED